MNIKYSINKIETLIFQKFFIKLKFICFTTVEFKHRTELMKLYKKFLVNGYTSNLSRMEKLFKMSIFSSKMKILSKFWKQSISEVKECLSRYPKQNEELCSICMEKNVNVCILHNKQTHSSMCSDCVFEIIIRDSNAKCPFCREDIGDIIFKVH